MPPLPTTHPYSVYATPLEAHASELAAHGTAWAVREVRRSRGDWDPHRIHGAVCPRSANGGLLWAQRNRETECIIQIDPDVHDVWITEVYEPATGQCYMCLGEGTRLACTDAAMRRWTEESCPRCGGTGRPSHAHTAPEKVPA